MKKIILFLTLILSLVCAGGLIYEAHQMSNLQEKQIDSATVSNLALDIVNPLFYTVDDVLQYKNTLKEDCYVDSVFAAIDAEILSQVANVVINKQSRCDKYDIIREFREHSDVYLNLKPRPTSTTNTNETEAPEDKPEETGREDVLKLIGTTSVNYQDTIIDGKKVKAKIVTHTTYE